ncbi:LysM peptidoglycan-binding domain-containing protein [Bacillaceae bacterium SIJ1]|uniref:LysM peptidoglycan-binding domain-containing protein n=1 Tax=Litoribacterium kuwaitense TaxID=1398745 RepID=UPI0013EA5ABF|nr:LysM peptidoglycan-binding domain-containing protein [Litoribacterium kuwaitense]NGP46678.1 LysM peptidoglycan-binding domain-containing protein [Litoribacterium kuwaitense]
MGRAEWHHVQLGESLYDIARKHCVTVDALMRENQLRGPCVSGQWLRLPPYVDANVVEKGDQTSELARAWGMSEIDIIRKNALRARELEVGQLLFRKEGYIVQPGDTLYTIAKAFQTTVASLEEFNQISVDQLQVGQVLAIPGYTVAATIGETFIYDRPSIRGRVLLRPVTGARFTLVGSGDGWLKVRLYDGRAGWLIRSHARLEVSDRNERPLSLLGYYTEDEGPGLPGSEESFFANADRLQDVSLFYYQIHLENPTTLKKFDGFTDEDVERLVNDAHARNVRVLAVVHNMLYREGPETISKDVASELVSSKQNRQALIANILKLLRRFDMDGIDLDIEEVYEEDRDLLSQFIIELGEALRNAGYFFSIAIPSKVSAEDPNAFAKPFNYEVIGKAADQVVVMLYNEHGWPGSGPGPVVSIGRMEQALSYAKTEIPPEKILGAVSVFGFDFNLTTERNRYLTYESAIETAFEYDAMIQFDEESQTPYYSYVAENGDEHEVWFEDARSILAKAELAQSLGIQGLALWRLGMEDPAIWPVLANRFILRKP